MNKKEKKIEEEDIIFKMVTKLYMKELNNIKKYKEFKNDDDNT